MKTTIKKKLYLHNTEDTEVEGPLRAYDPDFVPGEGYQETLPDMQNASASSIQGKQVAIQQVGISNFRLPLRFAVAGGEPMVLETSVSGTVTLDAGLKGINMSRIMRTFYEFKDRVFTPDLLEEILVAFRKTLGSRGARLKLSFSYPMLQESLRSDLSGYQYYKAAFEGVLDGRGTFRKFIHFDFIYSSACPCSAELSEHVRDLRNIYGIPHSQRSKARVMVAVASGASLSVEEIHAHCLRALLTETQVMVKREDEQAFAEMNGLAMKFVEDAARLLYEQLDGDPRIADFEVACAHLESLHSHDAVSVIAKGIPGGFRADFSDFQSLVC